MSQISLSISQVYWQIWREPDGSRGLQRVLRICARYTEDRQRAERVVERVVDRGPHRVERVERVAAQMTPLACSGCSCRGQRSTAKALLIEISSFNFSNRLKQKRIEKPGDEKQ